MSMINARGTTNGSAYAMWSVMLYGTCKQTDHGCTSCPTSMLSLRSQPLSSALLLKNKPREQHECTNLMHSDLGAWQELLAGLSSRDDIVPVPPLWNRLDVGPQGRLICKMRAARMPRGAERHDPARASPVGWVMDVAVYRQRHQGEAIGSPVATL